MTNTELNELIFNKLDTHAYVDGTMNALRFRYHGNTYRVTTNLNVEKVDGSDSDARQLEKLLRGEQWDGTGLPPVGAVIEVNSRYFGWIESEVIALTSCHIVTKHVGKNGIEAAMVHTEIDEKGVATVIAHDRRPFRPLRTERDKAIEQMMSTPKPCGFAIQGICENLYDAIVAGKIDGLGKVG